MAIGTTAALIGSAVIGAGASYAASRSQAKAAKSAANAQLGAANISNELQREIYQQNRADTQPGRIAGTNALAMLLRGYGYDVGVTGPQATGGYVPDGQGGMVYDPNASTTKYADEQLGTAQSENLGRQFQTRLDALLQLEGEARGYASDDMRQDAESRARQMRDQLEREVNAAGGIIQGNRIFANDELRALSVSEPAPTAEEQAYGLRVAETGRPGEFNTPLIYDPGEFAGEFQFDPSDILTSPAYQFRRDEGLDALERYRRASGTSMSGSALRSAEEFGSGLASQEYGNEFARRYADFTRRQATGQDVFNSRVQDRASRQNALFNLAGLGQTSVGQGIGAATNYANQAGSNLIGATSRAGEYNTQAANATAAGYAGAANAVTGGVNNYLLYNLLNKGA